MAIEHQDPPSKEGPNGGPIKGDAESGRCASHRETSQPARRPRSKGHALTGAETSAISPEERLLTVTEVAVWISFTPKGVYALVEARRIPFIKVSNRVRFLRSDVLDWLTENRVSALERGRR